MKIINNCKVWIIVLILISIVIFFVSNGIYYKYKRYITEDMQYSIYEINYHFNKSSDEIKKIISNKEQVHIDFKDVNHLMLYNRSIDRGIFELKKKCSIIDSELGNSFQKLWDNFNYNEQINEEDIRLFYDQLSVRADGKEYILLGDDDVHMFQAILSFYSNTKKEINDLIYENVL